MKILFLCAGRPRPDGPSDSVIAFNRIRLLAQRGHQIGLAAFLSGRTDRATELEGMVGEMELLPLPGRRWRVIRPRGFRGPRLAGQFVRVFSRDMQKVVGRMVSHSHCDVAVAESSVMGQYLYGNPHLPAVRRVVCCHGLSLDTATMSASVDTVRLTRLGRLCRMRSFERYETEMCRFSDRVIVMSLQERLALLRRCPELNVSIIPYGVDAAQFTPCDPVDSEPFVFITGHFRNDTDHDAVMWFMREIWPAVAEQHPGVRLRVGGTDIGRDVRHMAHRGSRIDVLADDVDLMATLPRARIYVCPVRIAAGFQGRLLRAMAAGVPVVATSIAAASIPVQTGDTMFLADTAHNFAEDAGLLLADLELRREIASNARRLVQTRFSWRNCVDKLEDVLRQVVAA